MNRYDLALALIVPATIAGGLLGIVVGVWIAHAVDRYIERRRRRMQP